MAKTEHPEIPREDHGCLWLTGRCKVQRSYGTGTENPGGSGSATAADAPVRLCLIGLRR